MRYPEKDIALFALLTGMNVTEICGLKWQYVNLSNDRHIVDDEVIPSAIHCGPAAELPGRIQACYG